MKIVDEKKILICIIGLLNSLKNGAISVDEGELYLFRPRIIKELKTVSCNDYIIKILEECLFLEDILSLFPNKYEEEIDRILDKAFDVLRNYPKIENANWDLSFIRYDSELADLISMRGEMLKLLYFCDNRLHLIFDKKSGRMGNSEECEAVFSDFHDVKQDVIFILYDKNLKKTIMIDEFIRSIRSNIQIKINDIFAKNDKTIIRMDCMDKYVDMVIYSKCCHCNWT